MPLPLSRKQFQRMVLLVSLGSFAGSMGYANLQLLGSIQKNQKAATTAAAEATGQNAQLQEQEKGYEVVLQREPQNQVALEGLVKTRLQLDDLKGAVQPLQTLVKIRPEQKNYKALLAELQKRSRNQP